MRRRLRNEEGSILMVMGVLVVLAVLAVTLVLVTLNTQAGTAATRTHTQAFDYAEAGLNSAMAAVTTATWPSTSGSSFSSTALAAAYNEAFSSSSRPSLVIKAYDNLSPINQSVAWDSNGDGIMWVDAQVTQNGQTSHVRQQVKKSNSQSASTFPNAALYSDGNISVGTGWVTAKNLDGTSYVDSSGNPLAAIYSYQGNVTRNSWNWPNPSTVAFKLGNGTDTWNGHYPVQVTTHKDNVGSLSSILSDSTVASLVTQAQAASPAQANASGTVLTTAQVTALQSSSPQTYSPTGDVRVNGNLTLGGGESWFNFKSLYVTGNLTLNGNTHTNCTSLYVGGNFTISGPSGTQSYGSTYVAGNVSWNGACSNTCSSLYVGGTFTSSGGPFTHNLGPTYVAGDVSFSGNQGGIIAPLFATGGNVTSSGSAYIGTTSNPSLLLVQGSVTKSITWGSNGTFTGLMANTTPSGPITISAGGNGSMTDVVGSLMCKGPLTLSNNSGLTYIPDVLAKLPLTTQASTATAVDGTWQEIQAQ